MAIHSRNEGTALIVGLMSTANELHVVFGAGALGRAIARELVKKGRRTRIVSRRGEGALPGVEAFKADAADPAQTRAACAGAAVVYHTATPDYTKWADLYPPIQRGVIEGAASASAKLVSAESVYMYGPVDGPMTEDRPHVADTRKGKIRAALARMAMEAHEKGRVRVALGRAPDFYGPEAALTTIYGDRVFYPALAGKKVSVMGKLDHPHTFICVKDFARGLVTLGERDEAMGQAWHLPCAPTITQRELCTMIFEEAGQKPNVGEAPSLVFSALGLFVPIMRELAEMLYQWERPYLFDHGKFDKAFGAGQFTPHREAVRETVQWFRDNPPKK
ncbi:Nucleoside-diphosphate-sugar epimerase [Minicystis rosea]|nr:Nucleoside-diphosphate-sugar epimerase [Minicystis rosea]